MNIFTIIGIIIFLGAGVFPAALFALVALKAIPAAISRDYLVRAGDLLIHAGAALRRAGGVK